MSHNDPHDTPIRSLTRLAVGGLLLASDNLQRQMRIWEQETTQIVPEQSDASEETTNKGRAAQSLSPSLEDIGRYALIGLIFETQNRIAAAHQGVQQADQTLGKLVAPLIETVQNTPALTPVREQFETMMARGEAEVYRWVTLGRTEEEYSREYVQTAFQISVETSIHEVVQHPEVHELVQQQSAGLVNEIVEEVRERAVSIDTFSEQLIRRWFGLTPRDELPEPPDSVREHAVRSRIPRDHEG